MTPLNPQINLIEDQINIEEDKNIELHIQVIKVQRSILQANERIQIDIISIVDHQN